MQGMLTEEEHESSSVFVHGPTLLFDQSHTFHNVCQIDLLLPRQLGKGKLRELFGYGRCYNLCYRLDLLVVIDREIPERLSDLFYNRCRCCRLL